MEEENIFSQVFLCPPHVCHNTPVEKESKEKETPCLLSVCSLLSDLLAALDFLLGSFSLLTHYWSWMVSLLGDTDHIVPIQHDLL